MWVIVLGDELAVACDPTPEPRDGRWRGGRREKSGKWSTALSHGQKYQPLNWDTRRETGLALGYLWQKKLQGGTRDALCVGWLVSYVHFNLCFFLWPGVNQLLCIPSNLWPREKIRLSLSVFPVISAVAVHVYYFRAAATETPSIKKSICQ